MAQKRIVAIFTGGTIGSRQTALGEIAPDGAMAYRLIRMYQEAEKAGRGQQIDHMPDALRTSGTGIEDVEFITEEPYYILSENLTGRELLCLADCVKKYLSVAGEEKKAAEEEGIDGIIIMHGTDTLQYTAAFLGLLFQKIPVPVVLVSSAFPLEDSRANGFWNFYGAVKFIRENIAPGVYVSYANEGESVKIHLGTRLLRSKEYSADVLSMPDGLYGSFTKEWEFVTSPLFREDQEKMPEFFGHLLIEEGETEKTFRMSGMCREVLRIAPSVGMVYPELSKEIKAVLFESYHSGTIGISEALRQFAKQAEELGIPMYLTGLNEEDADYETVGMYQKLGIVPLRNKTAISQYMKLWMLCSNGMEIRKYMIRQSKDHSGK